MGWIGRAWRGEERLWKVYWIYGWVVGVVFNIISNVIENKIGTILLGVVAIIYLIWLLVAEWRCAFNADWKFWSYVVRVLVIICVIGFILAIGLAIVGLFVGGPLPAHSDAPVVAAPTGEKPSWDSYYLDGCKQTMTDYAKQNNIDPEQYISQNQAWLQECVQAYKKENAAGGKKSP